VKIASKDTKTQDAVRTAINTRLPLETSSSQGPLYDAHFTLPTDPHNARGPRGSGKLYGVSSILRRDLYSKYTINIRTVDWDKEGRISIIKLTSKCNKAKLAIFNIYAVNGTENPYRNPETGTVRGTRHDRKRALHSLLARECRDLQGKGWHVLLAGDMNVAPDARDGFPSLRTFPEQHVLNRKDFHDRLLGAKEDGWHGVDVWRAGNGDARRYTYFPRNRTWGTSCDRVDYFVVGKKTWDGGLVCASGIMDSEAERGPSDHVPIWADFELKSDEEGSGRNMVTPIEEKEEKQ
jgi:exonuclease III